MIAGEKKSVEKIIVVGDRVLVRPISGSVKTRGGLLLPPGYKEKEEVQTGYIIKTAPGYPIPISSDGFDEPWKKKDEKANYIPLQAQVGDLAIFLKKGAVEIQYNRDKYYVVSQHSILLLERDELSDE